MAALGGKVSTRVRPGNDCLQYIPDSQAKFLYVRFRMVSLRLASANISRY